MWRDLSQLLVTMNDGHTTLWLATEEQQSALAAGQRVMSIGVARTAAGVVIGAVVGDDTSRVVVGEQLLRVGGTPIEDVVRELGRAVPAELDAYRDRVVLANFGIRLWLTGARMPLPITVANVNGVERTVTLAGATADDLQRQAVPRARVAISTRRTADSVLVVDFSTMGGDPQALHATLDTAFVSAQLHGLRAVVVDLRRNGGGNSQQGIDMLSYVTGDPLTQGIRKEWRASTRYRQRMKAGVTPLIRWLPASWFDGSIGNFFSIPPGDVAVIPFGKPAAPPANVHRLERPLCLLMGPGTFSSAMMMANTVRQSGIGTLIGEPTGEPPNAYGEVLSFRLPHSGLAGQVSSARFILDPDSTAALRGVLPHVGVVRETADIVAGRDPAMEIALTCGRAGGPAH